MKKVYRLKNLEKTVAPCDIGQAIIYGNTAIICRVIR
jgi:hypothetical protein